MVDQNTERIVSIGQAFTIDLEAIPDGGYLWGIVQKPTELELIGQEVLAISKDIGGNSIQRFTLSAQRAGIYSLTFELKRSWEKQPVKTALFMIRVS